MRNVTRHPDFWIAIALFVVVMLEPLVLWYAIIFSMCIFIAAMLVGGTRLFFWAATVTR